jgi:excinuclease UvrABC nuclease subunit
MIGMKIEYTIDNFSGLIEITEDRELTWSTFPLHPVIGVYILYNENKEIIYIGKSVSSIRQRLNTHLLSPIPEWTEYEYADLHNKKLTEKRRNTKYFSWIEIPKDYVDMVERYLIYKHKGKYNYEFNYR